jgi:hypothetical protein
MLSRAKNLRNCNKRVAEMRELQHALPAFASKASNQAHEIPGRITLDDEAVCNQTCELASVKKKKLLTEQNVIRKACRQRGLLDSGLTRCANEVAMLTHRRLET